MLTGFSLKKIGNAVVNLGRVGAIPVTGGASLLIPSSPFGSTSSPPKPSGPGLIPQAVLDEAVQYATQEAAKSAAAAGTNPPLTYMNPRTTWRPSGGVQPIPSGQYAVPPGFGPPPNLMPLPLPGSGVPSWLLPVGIGAVGLTLAYIMLRKKS